MNENNKYNDWKKIGNFIKTLEEKMESYISPENCFIIRLDGCCFKTFTRGFKKPFDMRIIDSLEKTTSDLIKKFNATIGFCQSDEITILFDKQNSENNSIHLYNGRIEKLCSIIASYTSVRFNNYMKEYSWEPKLAHKLANGVFFDARIICPTSKENALECFSWRHQSECRRNAIMTQNNFSTRELHGVSTKNALDMLYKKNIDVYSEIFPNKCLFGTFIKKKLVTKLAIDVKTGLEIECCRTSTKNFSVREPVSIDFIFSKYANDVSLN